MLFTALPKSEFRLSCILLQPIAEHDLEKIELTFQEFHRQFLVNWKKSAKAHPGSAQLAPSFSLVSKNVSTLRHEAWKTDASHAGGGIFFSVHPIGDCSKGWNCWTGARWGPYLVLLSSAPTLTSDNFCCCIFIL